MSALAATGYADELALALRLAHAAGELVMGYRGGPLDVERKAGEEPVTIADHRSSQLIVAGLRAAFPTDVIVSEELPVPADIIAAPRVWFVDPIDGTKDFIRGDHGFSVMIGLCVDGVPVVGVVHQPSVPRTFTGVRGVGAWIDDIAGHRAMQVAATAPGQAIRLVASASHRSDTIDAVKAKLAIADEVNIGSVGVKLGLIALGERDLYVNPWPKCKAWDTCAPEAILHAAGGCMTDVHGEALIYRLDTIDRPHGMVASNGHLHADVIARLASVFPRPSAS